MSSISPVVVLDDDLYLSETLSPILDHLNTQTVFAHSLPEFVDILDKIPLSACIVDINLGPNDSSKGLDALELIKTKDPKLPVVMYSSYADSRTRHACARLGADAFIPKGTDAFADVTEILESILRKRAASVTGQHGESGAKPTDSNNLLQLIPLRLRELPLSVGTVAASVNQQLIEHLQRNPSLLYELHPRQFEELVAELWSRSGFQVQLTPRTRDGGKDIYALRHTSFGQLLYLIECKRYAADRPVGVELVRSLYGVAEIERASMAVLATTSYFTEPAHALQRSVPYRLSLHDFKHLELWLQNNNVGF